MDFTWTAGWEASAAVCASPDGGGGAPETVPTPAPTPASSPQEEAESMILVSGPRVAVSGLRRADCRAGAVLLRPVLFYWLFGCSCAHFTESVLSSYSFFFAKMSSYSLGLANPAMDLPLGTPVRTAKVDLVEVFPWIGSDC